MMTFFVEDVKSAQFMGKIVTNKFQVKIFMVEAK